MNTSRISKGRDSVILGDDILSIFGYLYTEPNPDSYEMLVFKAIESLDLDSRTAVLDKASNYGLA
jgi:hypothetical protein